LNPFAIGQGGTFDLAQQSVQESHVGRLHAGQEL
jgi:hypothetical protein